MRDQSDNLKNTAFVGIIASTRQEDFFFLFTIYFIDAIKQIVPRLSYIINFSMKRRSGGLKNQLKQFYPVQTIKAKRFNIHTGREQYQVKWQGWADTSNTWQPISNIVGCKDLIENFQSIKKKGIPEQSYTIDTELNTETGFRKSLEYRPVENFYNGIQHFLMLLQQEMNKRLEQQTSAEKTQNHKTRDQKINEKVDQPAQQPKQCSFTGIKTHQIQINRINQNCDRSKDRDDLISFQVIKPYFSAQKRQTHPFKKNEELCNKQTILQQQRKIQSKKSQLRVMKQMMVAPIGGNRSQRRGLKEYEGSDSRVCENIISDSSSRVVGMHMVDGCIKYMVEDGEGQNMRIDATKEDLVKVNTSILLRFYENLIN